jgi:hypothetical protein
VPYKIAPIIRPRVPAGQPRTQRLQPGDRFAIPTLLVRVAMDTAQVVRRDVFTYLRTLTRTRVLIEAKVDSAVDARIVDIVAVPLRRNTRWCPQPLDLPVNESAGTATVAIDWAARVAAVR